MCKRKPEAKENEWGFVTLPVRHVYVKSLGKIPNLRNHSNSDAIGITS